MKMLSLVLFIFLTALLPQQSLAGNRLLFEQAGPTNWPIPPFSIAIAIGVASENTRQTIYVSTETYESVRAVIAKVGSPKANGYDMVFAVTEFNEGVPLPVVFVPDEVFVRIMDDISSAYKTHRQTIPPLITDITQRFPRLRPSQYLLFKQAGPRDWSIPPFSIAIGVASENTWLTIYVSTETYESVRAVIAKAGFPKTNGYDMVFAVTEFTDGSPLSVVFVPDEVVVQVMGDISSTYKAHHQTIPPMISTIMKSFPRPRYSLDPQ